MNAQNNYLGRFSHIFYIISEVAKGISRNSLNLYEMVVIKAFIHHSI